LLDRILFLETNLSDYNMPQYLRYSKKIEKWEQNWKNENKNETNDENVQSVIDISIDFNAYLYVYY
jgi:hypothetical protein